MDFLPKNRKIVASAVKYLSRLRILSPDYLKLIVSMKSKTPKMTRTRPKSVKCEAGSDPRCRKKREKNKNLISPKSFIAHSDIVVL